MAETQINLDEPPAAVPVVDEANQPWIELDEVLTGQRELDQVGKQDAPPGADEDQTTKGLEETPAETPDDPITDEAETPALDETPAIDYELMVPLPDEREPVSVSALKDSYIDTERSVEALAAKGDEMLVMRRELQQVISAAGQNVTPEMREQITRIEQQQLMREHQAMLAAKPEWKDATAFEAARSSMFQAARRYGFSDGELKAISDHRVIAMLDALAGYQARESKATKDAEPVRKAATTRRGRRAPPARKGLSDERIAAVAKSGTYDQKYDAMDQLLGAVK